MTNSPANLPPLHTQNPLERFSNRADDYAKYRPSYPSEAIDAILDGLGNSENLILADVGAGTGISSRLFAKRGAKVWAIEPNSTMRDAAQPHANVEFRAGTAEATGLPNASVDAVVCCQSFHWFEPVATLSEFHRILKPAGRVALMWNERNRDDAFTNQYTEAIRRAVEPSAFNRIDRKASESEALRTSPLFENYTSFVFTNSHRLDQAGLIGIALSASYVPKSGVLHDQLIQDLTQLYHQWTHDVAETSVILSYRTHLFLAHPRH